MGTIVVLRHGTKWKQSISYSLPDLVLRQSLITWSLLNAYMNRYKLHKTVAIFFLANPFSEKEYLLGVCHGWFHCNGLLELWGSWIEYELPTVGFEPGAFRLGSARATTAIRGLMSVAWLKVYRVWPDCAIFRNLYVAHCRCCKIICRELHFVISLQPANFLIGQTAKRYKYYMT